MLPTNKLSNVVTENDRLQNDLAKAHREIDKLRAIFLDPFARKKLRPANKEMDTKLEAIEPKQIQIHVDKPLDCSDQEVIRPDRETLVAKNMNATV